MPVCTLKLSCGSSAASPALAYISPGMFSEHAVVGNAKNTFARTSTRVRLQRAHGEPLSYVHIPAVPSSEQKIGGSLVSVR